MHKHHVLRRIRCPQIAVSAEKALVIGCTELLRVNNLKGIAVFNIFLAAEHIFIILLTALVTGELAQLSL